MTSEKDVPGLKQWPKWMWLVFLALPVLLSGFTPYVGVEYAVTGAVVLMGAGISIGALQAAMEAGSDV